MTTAFYSFYFFICFIFLFVLSFIDYTVQALYCISLDPSNSPVSQKFDSQLKDERTRTLAYL